jgi:hypothetical protein
VDLDNYKALFPALQGGVFDLGRSDSPFGHARFLWPCSGILHHFVRRSNLQRTVLCKFS